jgi:TPR repeat protein
MYAEGTGTEADLVLAAQWWRKAAQRNDDKAQYNLGRAYLGGSGLRKNSRLGEGWLKKAAINGNKKAAKQCSARGITWQ